MRAVFEHLSGEEAVQSTVDVRAPTTLPSLVAWKCRVCREVTGISERYPGYSSRAKPSVSVLSADSSVTLHHFVLPKMVFFPQTGGAAKVATLNLADAKER